MTTCGSYSPLCLFHWHVSESCVQPRAETGGGKGLCRSHLPVFVALSLVLASRLSLLFAKHLHRSYLFPSN